MMKQRIYHLLESPETREGRLFDGVIQLLIVASMLAYALETLPSLSPEQVAMLRTFEILTIGIFTIEYIGRVWVAPQKRAYIFSFYGIIDLLAIVPFYLSLYVDLRYLRAFRLLRLLRILKLVRLNDEMDLIRAAWHLAKTELLLFLSASAIIIYMAGVGIYFFEFPAQPDVFSSIPDSLWWAVVTLTTVGYGDMYPVTLGGRVFTTVILLVGLGLVAVPAGIISSALSEARRTKTPSDKTPDAE